MATAAFWLAPMPAARPSAAFDSTLIFDRDGDVLYDSARPDGGRNRDIPLAEMAETLRNAVIATEDPSFYENPGIAPLAIVRAAWDNLRHRRLRSGGSTITQQLVRNLYLEPGQRSTPSFRRKFYETFLARRLTASWSKDDILETYLNRIYFGNLAYGVEAAARTYFGKPARGLDLAESAFLAGLPQSPSAYHPFTNFDAAKERQATVLRLMEERGHITEDERRAALAEPLRPNTTFRATIGAGGGRPGAGVRALGRGAATTSEYGWSFVSADVPHVIGSDQADGSASRNRWVVKITFSDPMDREATKKQIRLEPTPETTRGFDFFWDWSGTVVNVVASLKPSTAYILRVAGGVDRYGTPLAQSYEARFTTLPLLAEMSTVPTL